MPGFNLGAPRDDAVSNVSEIRRKHRWTFTVLSSALTRQALLYLRSAARPHATFEVPELHHDQEMSRYAGKYSWDTITLVWYDIEQDPDIAEQVYSWLNSVINVGAATVEPPASYKTDASLESYNGAGETSEEWTLFGSWPSDVDWGDLDYTNTELQEVTATLVYDRAQRTA